MAENSWPFENADTNESQYTQLFREFLESGVISGLLVTTAAGMNLSVPAGTAVVQGWFYENTSAKALAVAAAPASGIRKDYVVLRVDAPANTITAVVKTGTASQAGILPVLTQTLTVWEHPIATITVPAGVANLVVTNVFQMVNRPGLRVQWYSSVESRANLPTDNAVKLGLNITTGTLDVLTGGVWRPLATEGSAILNQLAMSVGNSAKIGGVTVKSGGSAPTAPAVNDLWFP